VDYALARGGKLDTFTGLAGVGDLTATIMAPGSRNRRAGELLGQGTPADQIPGIIGQASEALDSVPQIADTVARAGIDCPGLSGLKSLIEGEISTGEWMAQVRRAERERRAA
jgi:glycerol-3-phosphate dehydrogenase (NAD(P)+)